MIKKFNYTVSLDDKNFIETIATYQSEIDILAINKVKLAAPIKGKQLPNYLSQLKTHAPECLLECEAGPASSMIGILPLISNEQLKNTFTTLSLEQKKIVQEMTPTMGGILFQNYQQRAEHFNRFIERGIMDSLILPKKLSGQQSLYFLERLATRSAWPAGGTDKACHALHIKPLAILLFQFHCQYFFIAYHNPLAFSFIKEVDTACMARPNFYFNASRYSLSQRDPGELSYMRALEPLSFDLEKGFAPAPYKNTSSNTPEEKKIIDYLQAFFIAWKNKQYQGPMIPISQAGFDHDNADLKNVSRLIAQLQRSQKSPFDKLTPYIGCYIASFFKEKNLGEQQALKIAADHYNRPNSLLPSITKGAELSYLLSNLSPEVASKFLNTLKKQLPLILFDGYELAYALSSLNENCYALLLNHLKEQSPQYWDYYCDKDGEKLRRLLRRLTMSQCETLLSIIAQDLKEYILFGYQDEIFPCRPHHSFLVHLLNFKTIDQNKIKCVLNALKPYLEELFGRSSFFISILTQLTQEARALLFDTLWPLLPALIKDERALVFSVAYLDEAHIALLLPQIEQVADKLPKNQKEFNFLIKKNLGRDLTDEQKKNFSKLFHSQVKKIDFSPLGNIGIMILGGFIAAVGIAAVALAFTALHVATFGMSGLVVASLGVVTVLTGLGLFAAGAYKSCSINNKSVAPSGLY